MEDTTTADVMVGALTQRNDKRYSFTVTVGLPEGGRMVIRECQLVGPSPTGGYSVYGPSRVRDGVWVELVGIPGWLRTRIRNEVLGRLAEGVR